MENKIQFSRKYIMIFMMFAFTLNFAFARQTHINNETQNIQETTNLLKKLINFRTVKGQGQVPMMAEYLRQLLIHGGFAEQDVNVKKIGETATLVANYRGHGSKRPMLISSHMDVVEAKPEDWTRDPFTMIEQNGYFYGRGILDNKLDLTSIISTVLRLKKEGFKPSRDIILVFSGDEETGMFTTKELATQFPNAEFLLNSDSIPGELATDTHALSYGLAISEKTPVNFTITTHNAGGHSSRPSRDNAIYDLALTLQKLSLYEFPVRTTEETLAYFQYTGSQIGGELGEAMLHFVKNPNDKNAIEIIGVKPMYAASLRTTCVATMLTGGHAINALPQSASATINCRLFPDETIESVRNKIVEIIDNSKAEVIQVGTAFASLRSPLREDVSGAVGKAVHANFPNIPVIPRMMLGATDSKYFRIAGIPSYGISGVYIQPKDMFSHGLDERIPVSAIPRALTHWYILLSELGS